VEKQSFGRWTVKSLNLWPCWQQQSKEQQMSEPESIKINEVEYVRKDALKSTDGDIKIVVVDRGFVYVGAMKMAEDSFVVLSRAKNIRKWGTTRGLGQLVSGPTATTVLDDVGTVRIPLRSVISIIDVEQKKWTCI
jgi:hypothetical protein